MLTHWRLKMDSMMDVIKRYNTIKIQQLFENEHVVLRNIPMTYCSGFDKLLQILIPDQARSSLYANTQLRAHRRAEEKKIKSKKNKINKE